MILSQQFKQRLKNLHVVAGSLCLIELSNHLRDNIDPPLHWYIPILFLENGVDRFELTVLVENLQQFEVDLQPKLVVTSIAFY